jgi:TonB family protein
MTNKMTQFIAKSLAFAAIFLLALPTLQVALAADATLTNGTELKLFGIGIHQEKRNDIYVGALYSPEEIDDVNDLGDTYMSKRMAFKFIAKYSSRQLSRLWKQRIAMNNAKSDWRPMTKEIIQFSRIFKQAMQPGDLINIDYVPGIGTEVLLNNTSFLTIEKPEFYQLLLNIWIGSIPPTEAFKAGITGKITNSLQTNYLDKFYSVETIDGRFDSGLAAPVEQVATQTKPAEIKKQPEVKKQPPKKTIVTKQAPVIPPAAAQTTDNTPSLNQPKTKVEVEKLAKKDLVDLGTLPEVKPKLVGNDVSQSPSNKAEDKAITPPPATKKSVVEKVAKLETTEQEDDLFDADLLAGSYTLDLINAIRKYQTYPKKALAAGDEGDVTIMVKIDREGQIVENRVLKRSGSRILDRAVLRMVRRAQPFPAIPKELEVDTYEFEVPLTFKISN